LRRVIAIPARRIIPLLVAQYRDGVVIRYLRNFAGEAGPYREGKSESAIDRGTRKKSYCQNAL